MPVVRFATLDRSACQVADLLVEEVFGTRARYLHVFRSRSAMVDRRRAATGEVVRPASLSDTGVDGAFVKGKSAMSSKWRPAIGSDGSRRERRKGFRSRRADECRLIDPHAARVPSGHPMPAAARLAVDFAVVSVQAPSDMACMRGVERQRRRIPLVSVEPHACRRAHGVDARQRGEAFAAGGLRDGLLARPDGCEAPRVASGPRALALVQIEPERARVDSGLRRLDIDADRPRRRDRASDPVAAVRDAEVERQIEPRTPVCRVVQRRQRRLVPAAVGERGEQQPGRDQAAVTRRGRRPTGDLSGSRNRQFSEPHGLECWRDIEHRAQMDRHRGARKLRPSGRQPRPNGPIGCA